MNSFSNSTKICNLTSSSNNARVTGVIIYRSPTSSGKALNILIRDSEDDSIVCVFWGPPGYNRELWRKCEFGVVITVSCTRVMNGCSSDFHPSTKSPFIITATDRSQVTFSNYSSLNTNIQSLLSAPLKPVELTLQLGDLMVNGEKGIGLYVDVFVLIRQIKEAREIKMKDRKTKFLRECILCDKSNAGTLLTLWSEDLIARSNKFQLLIQVLHIIDARVAYSTYYKTIYLISTSKTVILENPRHYLTDELLEYGLQINPFDSTGDGGMAGGQRNLFPSVDQITETMTCQRLLNRLAGCEGGGDGNEDQFTAVIYGLVTKFNIDEDGRGVKKKCSFCHSTISSSTECMEGICLDLRYQTSDSTYQVFDIRLDFSDHTGTLSNCQLLNEEGEKTLNCRADEFYELPWASKCGLKWRYLMERVQVKVVVFKRTVYRPFSFIRVVEIKLADPRDVKDNIRIF